MTTKQKVWIILGAIGAAVWAVGLILFYLHKDVLKAWANGEELPEVPEWHPGVCKLTRQALAEEEAEDMPEVEFEELD